MFATFKAALTRTGGLQLVLPMLAIVWGIGRLQALAEETQARIDENAATIAEQTQALMDLAMRRHPSGYPAPEDVDPLGRAVAHATDSTDTAPQED